MAWLGLKRRTLRETPSYNEASESLGNPADVDDALLVVTEAIARAPEVFPVLPGFQHLRIAKTDAVISKDGVKPGVVVWFMIVDSQYIDLLYIEEFVPDEEN